MTTTEIKIQGRKFSVEQNGEDYILTGTRGARYRTYRNANNASLMFLVNAKSMLIGAPDVWLTDKGGALEIVQAFA